MSDDILSLTPPRADARIAYGADPNQFFDLRMPVGAAKAEAHPLMVNIHGGYWRAKYDLEHAGHLCAALTRKGLATANLEFRRIGNDGGAWPGTFADIRSAYHFLAQNADRYHLDAQRIAVMGHSAGGQLALCLAAHEPGLKAAVSLAGVVDLKRAYELHLSHDAVVEFLGGTPAEVPDHYHEADPTELAIPQMLQWLIHGTTDNTVPVALSRDYVSAKQKLKEDAHLLELPHAGHYDLIDPRTEAWKRIEAKVLQLTSH